MLTKIKEFYKRKEMGVREQLALSAIKVSWRSSLRIIHNLILKTSFLL